MEEISEEKAWFDNTIQITDKKCYISVEHLWKLWRKETGNKHGIKHFNRKVCEYYGQDAIHKNTRKSRNICDFTNMYDEDVKEMKSNNSYDYDSDF